MDTLVSLNSRDRMTDQAFKSLQLKGLFEFVAKKSLETELDHTPLQPTHVVVTPFMTSHEQTQDVHFHVSSHIELADRSRMQNNDTIVKAESDMNPTVESYRLINTDTGEVYLDTLGSLHENFLTLKIYYSAFELGI